MILPPEKLAELEFEALQQEKRDKLNSRLQVWSLLVGLVGAFGVASVQSGSVAYVVALYPLLAACVARYAGHSESVLDQVKSYLIAIEQQAEYCGYEQYNKSSGRKGVGGHMVALRDAILLTDVLASIVVVLRLLSDGQPWLAILSIGLFAVTMILTCRWLRK